jgi:two-component system nitrate/nitrite response regulator NarL
MPTPGDEPAASVQPEPVEIMSQPYDLTPREMEVLRLMARGSRNKEIAETLTIAERTVKIHVGNILGKLNVTNRTEAVALAIKLGLLQD